MRSGRSLSTGSSLLPWAVTASSFMVLASAAIVTGILSWFFHEYSVDGTHIIYQEVVAVVTLAVILIGLIPGLVRRLRGIFLVLCLILSYLWLTSFIFSVQDWVNGECDRPVFGRCAYKKTITAFNFVAFFFLFSIVLLEAFYTPRDTHHYDYQTKERPGTANTGAERSIAA